MTVSRFPTLRRLFPGTWLPAIVTAFLVPASGPLPVAAGGLFQKRAERQEKTANPPRAKPFSSIFSPKKKEALRATPVEPSAPAPSSPPAAYQTHLPASPSAGLASVPRGRAGQLRVFVLGDSQSLLPFGIELQKSLVAAGHEVLFHGVKNGTPYYWQGKWTSPVLTRLYEPAASPEACGRWNEVSMAPRSITDYIASYDPDVFIIQAGTNFEEDLAGDYTAGILGLIDTSLRQASSRGAKVLWIGPPDARDDVKDPAFQERAVTTLRAALSTTGAAQGIDSFFDSRAVCPIPEGTPGDGEHPADEAGRAWGIAAGSWAASRIDHWRRIGMLPRTASPLAASPPLPVAVPVPPAPSHGLPAPAPGVVPAAEPAPLRVFEAEFELVAKSDPGDISTLPYTDAFCVYRYRLRQPTVHLPQLLEFGLPVDFSKGEPSIHVLHWAVHNDGRGPRATKVASRRIGDTFVMRICPLAEHPLGKPVGTMTQFNDFDDLLAPIFVSTDLAGERAF